MTIDDGLCWFCGKNPDVWHSSRHCSSMCQYMAHAPFYLQLDLGSGELEEVALPAPLEGWIRGNTHEFMIPAINKMVVVTVFKDGYYGHTIQDAYLRFE